MPHPGNTPLSKWPSGWLKMECARLLRLPSFLILTETEKQKNNLPATDAEMRDYISNNKDEWNKNLKP